MLAGLLRSPWTGRVAWVAVGAAASTPLAAALDGRAGAVQVVAAVLGWGAWASTLLALLVPRAVSLTVVRATAPAAVASTIAAAVVGPAGLDDAVAVTVAVVAAAVLLSGETADGLVDGSSYGDERRFALRTPPSLWPAAAVAWLLAVPMPVAGLLGVAAGEWGVGVAATVLGAAGARLGIPALHRLSRRWFVFVPAGVVVHDHVAVADPFLLRTNVVRSIAPATTGDDATALDLTLGAGGLPLVVDLTIAQDVPIASGPARNRTVASTTTTRLLLAPLRPGAVVSGWRRRNP